MHLPKAWRELVIVAACAAGRSAPVTAGRLYVQATVPVCRFGMVEADTAKLLRREHNKIILRWLGGANPPLNAMLVKSTLDNERCACSVCLCGANRERPMLVALQAVWCCKGGAARVGLQGGTCTLGHESGPAVPWQCVLAIVGHPAGSVALSALACRGHVHPAQGVGLQCGAMCRPLLVLLRSVRCCNSGLVRVMSCHPGLQGMDL